MGAAAVVAVLGLVAVVGYRVFAPGEIRSPARTAAYPTATPETTLGVSSELWRTPLLVDDHLRVYAAQRQVWADGPIGARTEMTPYWSFRRWPQEVTGIAVIERVVVSRWSDGELVALDVRTGEVSWRAPGPLDRARDDAGYTGRRTGAETVYGEANVHTVSGLGGAGVVVVESPTEARGYAASTGRELWRQPFGPDCSSGWTGSGLYARPCNHLVLRDAWTGNVAWSWRPAGAGPNTSEGPTWTAEPIGCAAGRSECRGVRTRDPASGAAQGWLLDSPGGGRDGAGSGEPRWPVPAPALAPAGSWLAGDTVIEAPNPTERLLGRSVRTGEQVWQWTGGSYTDKSAVTVVAATPDAICVISAEGSLIAIDPRTGHELARFTLDKWRSISATTPNWKPGYVYSKGKYVVVERLMPHGDPAADDNAYYFSLRTVLIAGW